MYGEASGYSAERRYVRKDGSVFLGHITTRSVRSLEGKFLYGIGMLEDISARKLAEEQLKTYQERLRSLASQLALTEERERRRIATVLHDEVGQALALARIKLSELAGASPRREFIARVRAVQEMIARMLARTRSLTFELSPPVLYELGLCEALGWLVEEFRKQHPLRWEFHGACLSTPLGDDVRVTLFQGARELLFNAVKHARARTVSVRVECGRAEVRVRVEDDGIGFAAHEFWSNPKAMTGFGLFSVRERLESLGGRLDTDSWPGGGARLTLAAPLASSGVSSKGG
jgi:signal transduction histidine kinase